MDYCHKNDGKEYDLSKYLSINVFIFGIIQYPCVIWREKKYEDRETAGKAQYGEREEVDREDREHTMGRGEGNPRRPRNCW